MAEKRNDQAEISSRSKDDSKVAARGVQLLFQTPRFSRRMFVRIFFDQVCMSQSDDSLGLGASFRWRIFRMEKNARLSSTV